MRAELLAQAIRNRTEVLLGEAFVTLLPFPHLVVPNFFPADVYAEIQRLNLFEQGLGQPWVDPSELREAQTSSGNTTPYDLRRQIDLGGPDKPEGSEAADFWNQVAGVFLRDDWFPRLVYRTLPSYFDLRFGEAARADAFWQRSRVDMFVQQYAPGFFLGPHTDLPQRVFTAIFSFASTARFEQYGTQILRPAAGPARSAGLRHHGFDGFDLVTTAPYRPNNFVLFFRTPFSFHAVPPIPDGLPDSRYSMQYQFWEPPDAYIELP